MPEGQAWSSGALRVTTWNVLAPVIDVGSMFPCVPAEVTTQEHRWEVIRQHFASLNSDVWLFQEFLRSHLDDLLAGPASGFDWHFVEESAQCHEEAADAPRGDEEEARPPRKRGVAVLWRKGFFESVTPLSERRTAAGNPAAIIKATWQKREVVFASKHMDALGCPPAATRCQEQLVQLCEAAQNCGSASASVIVGGDCNLTPSAPAMDTVTDEMGFEMASDEPGKPTCFAVTGGARLDHIFVKGGLVAQSTTIPDCEAPHLCNVIPCFHQIQMMMDYMGISRPVVQIPCQAVVACLLAPVFLLTACCCFCVPAPFSVGRCKWAIESYGSDHLPVTVTFLPKANAGP